MKSLFHAEHNSEIINRLNKLTPQSKAEWGKMNVSQMLAHCTVPLQVAFGETKLKRGLIGILFGNMAKKKLTKPEPFPQNMPTDKNFIVKGDRVFEEEKIKLAELVHRFAKNGENGISKEPHPFFGKLTTAEWDILQWKHLDHHFRQFGA